MSHHQDYQHLHQPLAMLFAQEVEWPLFVEPEEKGQPWLLDKQKVTVGELLGMDGEHQFALLKNYSRIYKAFTEKSIGEQLHEFEEQYPHIDYQSLSPYLYHEYPEKDALWAKLCRQREEPQAMGKEARAKQRAEHEPLERQYANLPPRKVAIVGKIKEITHDPNARDALLSIAATHLAYDNCLESIGEYLELHDNLRELLAEESLYDLNAVYKQIQARLIKLRQFVDDTEDDVMKIADGTSDSAKITEDYSDDFARLLRSADKIAYRALADIQTNLEKIFDIPPDQEQSRNAPPHYNPPAPGKNKER